MWDMNFQMRQEKKRPEMCPKIVVEYLLRPLDVFKFLQVHFILLLFKLFLKRESRVKMVKPDFWKGASCPTLQLTEILLVL